MNLVTPEQLAQFAAPPRATGGLPAFTIVCFILAFLLLAGAAQQWAEKSTKSTPSTQSTASTPSTELVAAAAPAQPSPLAPAPAVEPAAAPAQQALPAQEWSQLPDGSWIRHQRDVSALQSVGG